MPLIIVVYILFSIRVVRQQINFHVVLHECFWLFGLGKAQHCVKLIFVAGAKVFKKCPDNRKLDLVVNHR